MGNNDNLLEFLDTFIFGQDYHNQNNVIAWISLEYIMPIQPYIFQVSVYTGASFWQQRKCKKSANSASQHAQK